MAEQQLELYQRLSRQAYKEKLPSLGGGAYSALPPQFGRALDRLAELCEENGICHHCAYPIDDCICSQEDIDDRKS